MTGSWRPSAALYRALAVLAFGIGLGLAVGRADLVTLVAPIGLVTIIALVGRPIRAAAMGDPVADAAIDGEIVAGSTVPVAVRLRGLDEAELTTVLVPESTAHPTGRTRTIAGGPQDLRAPVDSRSWGPSMVARPDLMGLGPDGLLTAGPFAGPETSELVLPAVPQIPPLQLPPINGGWAGAHVSRRPGQGSDLVDLRQYAPGDRMRSVHWRAYARLGTLYTRRTLSDADADLTICLDCRHNIAPRVPAEPVGWTERLAAALTESIRLLQDRWSERRGGPGTAERREEQDRRRRSSLDHTVAAAAAIASAQLGAGDRVGLLSIGTDHRSIRPGTGTRHLQRIRYFLANTTSSHRRITPAAYWGLRPGAVVVLCTPLADDEVTEAALDCAARGHQVLVVDTLPERGIIAGARGPDIAHLRLLAVERGLRIETIRNAGIPVVSWEGGRVDLELAVALKALRGRR